MSGMHDYDKTCGGVIQDDEHMELTTNNIFKTLPAAKLNLRCVIKAGFQDVAEKCIPLPNTTNSNFTLDSSSDFAYCELPYCHWVAGLATTLGDIILRSE